MLGVALLREGWQKDYFGNPPIHKTFGVGKIIDSEQLPDGRYNIMVEGRYRARLITEHATRPYRAGRVYILQDAPLDGVRDEVACISNELAETCQRLSGLLPEYRESIQGALAMHPHPGVTVDLLASSLVIDSYDRQSILESPDPIRRMKLTLIQVHRIIDQIAQNKVQEEVFEED